MLAIARLAMKSPWHANFLALGLSTLPLLQILSAALVALVTLRHGIHSGAKVLLFSVLGLFAPWLGVYVPSALLMLLILLVSSWVLKQTLSWEWTNIALAAIGFAIVVVFQDFFQSQYLEIINGLKTLVPKEQLTPNQWEQLNSISVAHGSYFVMMLMLLEVILVLLLSRYWQAGLYNPGGLKREIHAFRFNKAQLIVLSSAFLVSIVFFRLAAIEFILIPFIFAGLALLHGIVAKANLGGYVIVAVYVAFLLAIQIMIPLLVLLVLIDSVLDIRERLERRLKS